MDSQPVFVAVARALRLHNLEAILIGNAAALHGAPVTTNDLDFLIRKTPANMKKLKAIAKKLGAVVFESMYPAPSLIRIMRDEDGLQLRFVAQAAGIPPPGELQGRAIRIEFRNERLDLRALRIENNDDIEDQIRRLQARPINERTHFLRKRIGITASVI